MQTTRWQKIEQIFNEAVGLSPETREQFVAEKCGGDDDLCREILALLIEDSQNSAFLNEPLFSDGLRLLDNDLSGLLEADEFARYKLLKLLGRGGMGAVFLARDGVLDREVALKILPPRFAENGQSVERFRQEARAASAISHPNVAHIYEFGASSDRYFLAMEYVEGKTLRELLKENSIDKMQALDIALQIAEALAATHKRGVIHRDIKPENVIVTESGLIKILDFGLAKLNPGPDVPEAEKRIASLETTPGMIIGTTAYMSPEQVRGLALDARTDLWSLGVLLFEMLAGARPFAGETPSDIQAAILLKDIDAGKLPTEAASIVGKLLKKDLNERCRSAVEAARELRELKQNLEFDRPFSSGEISRENFFFDSTQTTGQTRSSAFLTGRFWNERKSSHKVLALSALIALTTFGAALAIKYYGRFGGLKASPAAETFAPDSRGRLQISTLFSTIRKPDGGLRELSFSPDGKFIAFTVAAYNLSDIYVKELAGGEAVRLTGGKEVNQSPIWSLDGREIAFVSVRDGKSGIWTVPYTGGPPVFRTSLEDIGLTCFLRKWSNDGRRIYYESCKKLFTVELDSGKVTEITVPEVETSGDFSISTDEKLSSFVAVRNKKSQIFTASLENGELSAVLKNDYHNWSPVFFPDRQRIAYTSDQNGIAQIYVSDLLGSEPSQITFGDVDSSYPVVSPDGKNIAYISESDEANIFSLDLKSGKESRQTSNTKMQLFPRVAPDNQKMIFQTSANNLQIYASPLRIKELGSDAEAGQTNLLGGVPRWAPGSHQFAFLRRNGLDINIWKTDSGKLIEKQLTFGGILVEGYAFAPYNLMCSPFDWSPDGKKIVYSSKQSGFNNLWTIDDEGGSAQMLTGNEDGKIRFNSPLWSPDGSRIAFIFRRQLDANEFRYGIAVLNGGAVKNLFETGADVRLLGWLENDILAVVQSENAVDLVKFPTVLNAGPVTVASLNAANIDGMTLAPDAKKIAYSAVRNGVNNVFVFSPGGKESQLTSNTEDTLYYSGISWSPDSANLFYSKQTGGLQLSLISDSP